MLFNRITNFYRVLMIQPPVFISLVPQSLDGRNTSEVPWRHRYAKRRRPPVAVRHRRLGKVCSGLVDRGTGAEEDVLTTLREPGQGLGLIGKIE